MADTPSVPLPGEPSLEQLRKQAKGLRRAVLAGDQGRSPRRRRFDGTPLSWARHFGQAALVELLEPRTA